ncbi:MAG: L-threonylcarbamoyladenylate synthase [Massiliimalia sp.]|jgi:L-threonylcarbamoyladenylate synthase
MKKTSILQPDAQALELAKQDILNGEVVGMPTETVYGLAANAFDEDAIKKIFEAKGRPQDNPLIVHIADLNMIDQVADEFSQTAQKLADAFWPGPLTMILPKSQKIPMAVTAGLETVGVRMPSHPVARDFIRTCGVPIAAPSANVSGKPSPTKASHVYHDLEGKIGIILDGGECEVGLESTVVLVGDDQVNILRPGKITVDDFLKVVSQVQVDDGVFTQLSDDRKVASPGMKYKHYSPNANVIMVEGSFSDFCNYVSKHADEKTGVLVFEGEESLFSIPCVTYGRQTDSSQQANRLFDALRELDQQHLSTVFARVPDKDGVGMAVYNRLLRACGFEVVRMEKPLIIGLTGQTGSGKSTICKTLIQQGVMILDCDEISRDVIHEPEVMEKLVQYFGQQIVEESGDLNRRKLANMVFTDEENRIYLNSVMYPRITAKIQEEIDVLQKKGCRYILLDAPTLFESGADRLCDTIVSVLAPAELRRRRIMERDSITATEALNRMSAQQKDDFYRARSAYVIENKGSLEELERRTVEVFRLIKEKADGVEA